MSSSSSAYAVVGLMAIVAVLMGMLVYGLLRFAAAARDSKRLLNAKQSESAFVTTALQEALTRLKAQERQMSARAEASERLNEEIVESLTAGLFVVGNEGEIKILNPAGRRMLGMSEAVVSKDYRIVLRDLAPLLGAIETCLTTGEETTRRAIEIASHGELTHLGVSVSALTDEKGDKHGVICLFTDLTRIMDMETQLRLKDSLARVGELTAGIAHEFRNGLATIHGYARLLDLNALPAPYRSHVEGIRQETDSLGEIVTNFLNFARPAQLTLSPVDLQAIVERAADEVRAEARTSGGDVLLQGEFPVIEGDDVLLRQAFSNLARNAVEANLGGGPAPLVVIEGHVDGDHVRVTVDDNGPGIPPADRDRIFQPFYTTKGRGTGLGLSLVQKIVVTHNGRIQVLASPAGGASFQVVLPLASAAR